MIGIQMDRVGYTHATVPIFENLNWEIHDDRCVGLVGLNGTGKSTLLRLMAGDLSGQQGNIVRRRGLTVGYLEQDPQLKHGQTLWDVAFSASAQIHQIEESLVQIEEQLANPQVYGNELALSRALARQERLLDEFEKAGGRGYEGRVRSTLRDLGFVESDFHLPVTALSGGQRKLAGLARLLLVKPDLLLLDEPDNHLDLQGKALLEKMINGYAGGVVIVSHDRFLLDLVVDEIAELEDGQLTLFSGSYSEYAFEKEMRLLRQQQLFMAQQKQVTRLEQAAKRLLLWGKMYDNPKFSRRGQNIQNRLEKMDRIDRPMMERPRMDLQLSGWVGSSKVLEITNLDKGYTSPGREENIVLAGLNLLLMRGERVGLVGPNGAGKSVLFRLILGVEQPSGGQIVMGPSIKASYYAQQHETLKPEQSLIETVRHAADRMKEEDAVAFLGKFLFTYEQARSQVKTLSGGERSRLQMAMLMLSGANFLLLDEPTNHLDIASAEVLENALEDFNGTVLVISHDRYFLDRVVTRIVELDQGMLAEFAGNFSDYQAKKAAVKSMRF
jgi:ATP-binding cassette, subfamily F, member 3